MTRAILAVFAVLAVVWPSAATASPAVELEADYAAALGSWGIASPPDCGSVTFASSWSVPDPAELDDPAGVAVAASATIPTHSNYPCVITAYEPAWSALSPCMRQALVRHEVGHLQAIPHSADPTSIMDPALDVAVWCPAEVPPPAAAPPTIYVQDPVAIAEAEAREAALSIAEWRRAKARCQHLHGRRARSCRRQARALRPAARGPRW